MKRCHLLSTGVLSALLLLLVTHAKAESPDRHADILINPTVVTASPEPYGGHCGFQSNRISYQRGAFEAVTYTNFMQLTEGGDDWFRASPDRMDNWESIGEGALNGAEVRFYRIENEVARLLRKDIVLHWKVPVREVDINGVKTVVDPGMVTLENTGPALQAGDYVLIRAIYDEPPVDRVLSKFNASDKWDPAVTDGSYTVFRTSEDAAPVPESQGSLKIDGSGVSGTVKAYSNAIFDGPGNGWYDTLEVGAEYKFELWMKADRTLPSVEIGFTQEYHEGNRTFSVGTTWQKYEWTFIATTYDVGPVTSMFAEFTGPGILYLDEIRLYKNDSPQGTIDPHQMAELTRAKPGSVRNFGAFHYSVTLDNWAREEYEHRLGWNWQSGVQDTQSDNKLPTVLRAAQQSGGQPWLVLGMQMNEDEWYNIIEYLATPYDPAVDTPQDKPWAYRRYTQGQQEPWTDVFEHIRLEYGNETWNPMFQPFYFGSGSVEGRLYGIMAEFMFKSAASHPDFSDDEFDFALNGWVVNPGLGNYGASAAQVAPHAELVGTAPYIGGWESGVQIGGDVNDDPGFQDYMLNSKAWENGQAQKHAIARDNLYNAGVFYETCTYEAGPSYMLPGTGTDEAKEVSENYGKSQAAAVVMIDNFLYSTYCGYTAQHHFTFNYGVAYWCSHAPKEFGGHPYPSWLAVELINRFTSGDMVLPQYLNGPSFYWEPHNEGDPDDFETLSTYAFHDTKEDSWSIVIINHQIDERDTGGNVIDPNAVPFTLRLPFNSVQSIDLNKIEGDVRRNNRTSYEVQIESESISTAGFNGVFTDTIPAGSIRVYQFKGASETSSATNSAVIAAAPEQEPVTTATPITFYLHFDSPVTGLMDSDISFLGTATVSDYELSEVYRSKGASYKIEVTGVSADGTIVPTLSDAAGDQPHDPVRYEGFTVYHGTPPASMAPVIEIQPYDVAGSTGQTVVFSVAATGNPAVSYQWMKNGTPISGATDAKLVLANVPITAEGNYSVQVSNSAGTLNSQTANLSLQPFFVSTTIADANENSTYSETIPVSGGAAPYSYALVGGTLPSGLSLDSATGVVSGTPTVNGSFNFTVEVTDSLTNTAQQAYILTVLEDTNPQMQTAYPQAYATLLYEETLGVTGGNHPMGFELVSGTLPAGIELRADGTLYGVTDFEGTYAFELKLTDSDGDVDQQTVTINFATSPNPPTYEGMAYVDGVDLALANGGTGWATSWTDEENGLISSRQHTLSYTDGNGDALLTVGNSMASPVDAYRWRLYRDIDTTAGSGLDQLGLVDANGNVGADGTTLYQSFIIKRLTPNTGWWAVEWRRDSHSDSARTMHLRSDYEIRFDQDGVTENSNIGHVNDTVFVVLRIDYTSSGDTLRAYFNPPLDAEPATADFTRTCADLSFDSIALADFSEVSQELVIDEIRIGGSWLTACPIEGAVPPPTGFAAWIGSFFTGADAAATGDPDSDTASNFMEYAFNLQPDVNDAKVVSTSGTSGLPRLYMDGGALKLEVVRLKTGATYTVQQSTDLSSWSSASVTESTPASIDADYERVVYTLESPVVGGTFYRIRVVE